MEVAPRPGHHLRFGLFQLNLSTGELQHRDRRVRLQEQPFRILTLLLERPFELVTREELRQRLWPADTFVDFDDGLNAAVKKLRFALSDSSESPRFVETIPRRGYRFIAPVAIAAETPPPTPVEPAVPHAPHPVPRPANVALRSLAVFVVVALAAAWVIKSKGSPPPAPADPASIRSIVVLPLMNLSNDPEQ